MRKTLYIHQRLSIWTGHSISPATLLPYCIQIRLSQSLFKFINYGAWWLYCLHRQDRS